MHVGALDARERAIAETARGRVVDALHLGDGLGVLADFDRERDVIAAATRIVGIGDLDRGRLEAAPPAVAALRLARFQREDHPLGERHAGAVRGLEARGDGLDDFGPDHDVGLHRVVQALLAAGPVAVALAGVRRADALHVDDADLARLALLIVSPATARARLSARRPSRSDPVRAARTRPSSTPACTRRRRRRGRAARRAQQTARAW